METTSKRKREEIGDGERSLSGGPKFPGGFAYPDKKEDDVPVGPVYLPSMPILGPSYPPSMSNFDNTRSEKERALLRIKQELQTILCPLSINPTATIHQQKQVLELKSSTQMTQQNQVTISPIVPTSAIQTSTQPSYSQPRQQVSINQTATIHQQKQLIELRSPTPMSQKNQVSIRPIVPTSATPTSTQPSYSQPQQNVSTNQTATIHQQKQLQKLIPTQMSQQNQVSIRPIVPTSATPTSTQPSYSQPQKNVSTNQTATIHQQKQLQKLIPTQMSQQNQVSIRPIVPTSATQTSTQPSYSQLPQHISINQTAIIHHKKQLLELLQQRKQLLEPRSSTQTSQQNHVSIRPIVPISTTQTSTQPSYSQPQQHVSINHTATIHQQKQLLELRSSTQTSQQNQVGIRPIVLTCATQTSTQPTRSATQPTATLVQNSQQHKPSMPSQPTRDFKDTMKEIEDILSNIVGQEAVKSQIRKWGFRLLQDEKRRALGLDVGQRKALHMAFFGNPGTGKTMIARTLGKVLHLVGLVSNEEVTEVQRTDLVGQYIGHTGVKTRKKIEEASGGILFVDEAYRLMPHDCPRDFGIEALEEIMAAMNRRDIVIIFAGYNVEMNRLISANPGLFRRVSNKFYFDDYTLIDMARILQLKMDTKERDSFTYGYRLDSDCSVEAISELIEEHTTEEQRKKMNGGIVDPLLVNALEHLDLRLDADCTDASSLLTITMEDLEEGLKSLDKLKNQNTGSLPQEKTVGICFDRPRAVDVGDDLDCLPPAKRRNIYSDWSHPVEVGDPAYVGSSGTSNSAISWKKELY